MTWTDFLTAFIPLFVAIDPVGLLPIYVGLTNQETKRRKRIILFEATGTAFLIGILFLLLGKAVFHFLGITMADFRIAGGIILFILAIMNLLFSEKEHRRPTEGIGVVPLGMPLIVGPATLTALLVGSGQVGNTLTIASFLANLLIVLIVFSFSNGIIRLVGNSGTIAFSKVSNLLLAAFGIMIIRVGLLEIVKGF